MTSNTFISISDDKKWTLQEIIIPCTIDRIKTATLPAGTNSKYESSEKTYQRKRTNTKSIVTETNSFTTVFEHAVNSTVKVGLPLPIKILPIKAGEVAAEKSTRFELALSKSIIVQESYEEDTEFMFEEHEQIEYGSHDTEDYVVYEEKMYYGSTEVFSKVFCESKKDWEDDEVIVKTETFETTVHVPVDYYWFNLQTDEGHNLHIQKNNPKSDLPLIVHTPKETAAQLWRWDDGNRLCSRHEAENGEHYYVKVAGRSSKPNQNVGVWKGKVENNLAEVWEGANGKDREMAIKNGHGWFLSVRKGAGKNRNNNGVIVWGEFNDKAWQKWNFVHYQPRKVLG